MYISIMFCLVFLDVFFCRLYYFIFNEGLLQNGDSAHVLRIFDDEAQAMQSARNSSIMLEEAYATGVAVLSKYAEQRDRLKVIQVSVLENLPITRIDLFILKSKIKKLLSNFRSILFAESPKKGA